MGQNVGAVEVEFRGDKRQLNKDLNELERDLGQATGNMGKDMTNMNRHFAKQFRKMGMGMKGLGKSFANFEDFTSQAMKLSAEEIDKLPDHLKGIGETTNGQANMMRYLSKTVKKSMGDISKSVDKTRVGFEKMESINKVGKSVTQTLNEIRDSSKGAQLAALGLNKQGIRISAAKSEKEMAAFNKKVMETRAELQKLKDSGDFLAYNEGMRQLDAEISKVNKALQVTSRDGKGAYYIMRDLGIMTSDMANASALAMERYKDVIIRSNDILQARTTNSMKQLKALDGQKFYGVSKALLRLGDSLEKRAAEGSALNLALKRVGKDASFKEINDEMRRIQQNATAVPMLFVGFGVAWAAATAGLVLLSNKVDGRLIPAFEEFKEVWLDALRPFIKAFTTGMVAVIKFGTWIGKLAKNFAETHPQLSQMAWGIGYLTLLFGMLLAPLAVGAGWLGSWNAVFSVLFTAVKAIVAPFLTLLGVALLVAGVVVVVVASINNMWKASAKFRDSIIGTWERMKAAAAKAVEPIAKKWDELKDKFGELISSITGGGSSMGDFWKWFGDVAGDAINFIANTLAPGFSAAMTVMSKATVWLLDAVIWLIDGIIFLMPYIIPIVKAVVESFKDLVEGIADFVEGLVKVVKAVFTGDWQAMWEGIKQMTFGAVKAVFNYLMLFGSLGFLGKIFGKVFGTIAGKLKSFAKTAQSSMTRFVDDIVIGFGKAKAAVVKWFGDMKTGAVNGVKAMYQSVKDWFLRMYIAISEAVMNFVTGYIKHWTELRTNTVLAAKGMFTKLWETFTTNLNTIVQIVVGWVRNIIAKIVSFGQEFGSSVDDLLTFAQVKFLAFVDDVLFFYGPFITKMINFFVRLRNGVVQHVTALKNAAIAKFNELVPPVVAKITGMVSKVVSKAQEMGRNVVTKVTDMKNKVVKFVTDLYTGVVNKFNAVKTRVVKLVTDMYTAVINKYNSLKAKLVITAENILNGVANKFESLRRKVVDAIMLMVVKAVNKFDELKGKMIDKAKRIALDVAAAFVVVKNNIIRPIEQARDAVLRIVGRIQDAFRNMKLAFPKIKVPRLSIGSKSKTIMGKEFSVPTFDISWNAKGAIFNGATLLGGGQGVGEAGAEAVIPIQHRRYMAPFAGAISDLLQKDGGMGSDGPSQVTYEINVPNMIVREEADIRRIVDELERRRKQAERSQGLLA